MMWFWVFPASTPCGLKSRTSAPGRTARTAAARCRAIDLTTPDATTCSTPPGAPPCSPSRGFCLPNMLTVNHFDIHDFHSHSREKCLGITSSACMWKTSPPLFATQNPLSMQRILLIVSQSINQSINQSTDQPTNQSINLSINKESRH